MTQQPHELTILALNPKVTVLSFEEKANSIAIVLCWF